MDCGLHKELYLRLCLQKSRLRIHVEQSMYGDDTCISRCVIYRNQLIWLDTH